MVENKITQEHINSLFYEAVKEVQTVFDKCTIMACRLKNGFVIVESSACVDPSNYDFHTGIGICEEKIKNKLWELEGYRLQCELERGDGN